MNARRTSRNSLALSTPAAVALTIGVSIAMAATEATSAQTASSQVAESSAQSAQLRQSSATLYERVRRATARFRDLNAALAEGFVPGTPCVSGPNSGAMGVHFILPSRVGDGVLNPEEPEALIYEPQPNGSMRLVAVEFIVLVDDWAKKHPDGGPAVLEGNLLNLVTMPNRYGLPAFYEIHVWAWEHNPEGTFADWNRNVTCFNQAAS